jgi:hypothetical protein
LRLLPTIECTQQTILVASGEVCLQLGEIGSAFMNEGVAALIYSLADKRDLDLFRELAS